MPLLTMDAGEFYGVPYAINPLVPKGRQYVVAGSGAVAFHDRYDLATFIFWSRMKHRLDEIDARARASWRAIRGDD